MAKTFSFEEALKPASQAGAQQEPRTFSFEEAMKPAAPQQQQPTTFSFEEAMKAPEQPTFIDARGQKPPEPRPEDQSFLRSVADVPLNITQGGVSGIRMIADAFGADSSTSKTLRGVEDYLGDLMSAQAKQDKQEISRIMKEAEDKGVGDQVLAGLKALTVAPVDTVANALGTSAPAIIGGLGALFLGAPAAVATTAAVGIGSAMGAGTIKSAIYDATKEELTKLKLPPDEVERRAEAAQAYGGNNLDQIAIGTALGGLSAFGFETATLKNVASNIVGKVAAREAAEGAVAKGVGRRVGEHVVKEAVPEGIQGSQEQLAQNLALQREGIDTPTMRGVISQGVLEAGASAPLGAYAGLREKQPTADTTGAGDALRRLDELVQREEEAETKEKAGTKEKMTVPKEPLFVFNTPEEAQERTRLLKLNRPKENFAVQETEDGKFGVFQIPVDTTGGADVTAPITDAGGVGIEDTGKPPEDTGAGVPPSSEGTGLGVSDTDATGAGASKGVQSSTLAPSAKVYDKGAYIPSSVKGEDPVASASFKTLDEDNDLSPDLDGATFITGMNVRDRNKGTGTKLLSSITEWADANNKTLALVAAASPDSELGGLSQEELKQWYARNGFEDKVDYMVRKPNRTTTNTGAGAPEGVQPYTLTQGQFRENTPQVNIAAASVFSPNFQFTTDADQLLATSTEEDIRLANKLLGLKPVVDIKRAAKNVADAYQNIFTAYSLNSAQVEGMKLPELKEVAKSLGLSTFGNKPELIEKINSFLPNAQAKFTERVSDHIHEQSVLNAVREGKPVSDEVLQDYPEIAAYGSPTGSAAYVAGVKKLAIKWLPTHLMEVPSTVQNLRDSAKESGVTAKEAQTLNDVADAMEEYYKNAFGKKEETSAAATSAKEESSKLLALKKITTAKYAVLQEALKAQKAAIAEYENTPGSRSDDRSSPEYHNLSVAVNAVATANAEYEAAERAENEQYEKFRAAQKAGAAGTSTAPVKVDKLQQAKDKLKAVSDKLFSIYKQREQLLTSSGNLPAPNSKARQKHDALMDEIKELRRQKNALEMEIALAEDEGADTDEGTSANVGFTGSSYAYRDPIAALVDTLPLNQFGVNKLQRMLKDNKLSFAEYTQAMTELQDRMRDERDMKSATTSGMPKKRGFGRLMEALEDAAKQGKISPQAYKMVRWFVSKNPEIARDLAISIAQPKGAAKRNEVEGGVLGEYNPVQRLVEIFLRFNPQDGFANYNNSDVNTAIHEVLHHLERLMPKELQAALRNEWAVRVGEANKKADQAIRQINAQIKKQEGILKNPSRAKDHEKARAELARLDKEGTKQRNILTYLAYVNEYNKTNNVDAADLAQKMITKGDVPHTMYALFDPSEFWAVTGSDIIAGRYGVSTQNKFKKIAQFLKEFIEYVKEAFGMPNDAPLLRGLKAILEGNGQYLSKEQLRTGTRAALPNIKGWEQADTGVSDEELKTVETAMAAGSMHPTVVDAIANNDLAGALKAISQKVSGFYGELATRLAELNLPTGTRIGDQRNMTRRAIDLRSAEAQKTLFDFVRTMMPDVYAKYFENYDRAENLERVYKGLNAIVGETAVKPVSPQLDTVIKAFDDAMKGLTAHGGYYPSFDLINLNPTTNQGLSYRVFLHETVHAATVMLLNTPADQRTAEQNEAIAELEKLFEAAKANTNIGFYGFRNLKEFIAEIYTNKEFQAELRKIPYPPARTNMFSRFVKLVMDMFGMDNITGRAMIEANKLFNADRSVEPVSAGPVFSGAKGKGSGKPRIRGPISTGWRTLEDTIQSVKDWENSKKDIIPAMWDAGNGIFRNIMLGIMNLRQIADVTKTKFPQIASSIRIIEKMLAYRGKIMNEGGEIIQRWTKAQAKNLKGSQLLGRLMLETTIRGVEVDPTSSSYDSTKVNPELMLAWIALGPDFQQIYRDVRDFYKRAVDETVRLMKERANQTADIEERKKLLADIDAQFGPDKLKGPYFPLRRFGEFWFQVGQGNFKEFYTYESRLDRNRAMAARKRELSKGNAQQRALAESIHSGNGISELYSQNVANTKILKDLDDTIEKISNTVMDEDTGEERDKTQAELKAEVKDALNQLIYIILPQQSMRKMFINRKAIQGASGDMLRVFATHAVHSAYQRSRFKYAQEFMDNLSNAHKWIRDFAVGKDYEVYRDYINEVEKRSKVILGTEDTSLAAKVAGKASEATFFFMLSSPFTAILNTIGFAQVAMPYIGGKFGYVNANKRILENMGKYLKTAPTRTFSPLTKGHMAQVSFPSIVEGGQLEGILKDAAKQLLDEEQINISLTNDVFDIGSRPSATYTGTVNAVKRAVSGLFHQSERLNREITLLSVVELAYEKLMSEPIKDAKGIVQRDEYGQPMHYTDNATSSDGKTQYSQEALQLAINEAKDIAGLALGDFTRQMKPRFFTPPLMSVLTKFKQYSVMASYAIIRNAQLGLIKPFSKKELNDLRKQLEEYYETDKDKDKIVHQQMLEAQARQKEVAKEARRRLAGILGMTYLFGGYAAMPFFSLLTPILVGMLAGADDDDDEFFNWENWFKNYIETEFGGYAGAMLQKFGVEEAAANKAGRKISEGLMYGPGSVVTGGALSDRVSLDLKNLWYRDGRYSPDTRESIVEGVIANAGPVVGLTVNAADAWDMAQNGQIGRAFEKMAPALFAKPITAARLATEGGKTKGGDTLVDEFTTAELAIQAVGLQPLNLAQAQKASIETVQKAQKITNQHDSIMNRLWMERENAEAFNDALEDAIEFSIRHPGYAITSKKIRESFEKRAKESGLANIYGARIPKPLRGELMGMPEYGRE